MVHCFVEMCLLCIECSVEQIAAHSTLSLDSCQDAVVYPIEQPRHGAEYGGSQFCNVVQQFGGVSLHHPTLVSNIVLGGVGAY